jgi:hypothetical protein
MKTKITTVKIKSDPLPKKNIKNGKKQSTNNPKKAYADLKKELRELFSDYCNLGLSHSRLLVGCEELKFQVEAFKGIFCQELNFLLDAPLWIRLIRIFNKKYLPKCLHEQFVKNATAFREEAKKRFEPKQ